MRKLRINLVNMPFAALTSPSLALTQLKSVVDADFGDRVDTRILYLNHEFADFMGGVNPYEYVLSLEGLVSGIGDWVFRGIAFPEAEDNTEAYFRRYYSRQDEKHVMIRNLVETKRPLLEDKLNALIDRYELDQSDIVGFTSLFSQSVANLAMAAMLKKRRPDIVTVMGGPGCEAGMGQEICRNAPQMDFIFSGPALKSFPEFTRRFLDGEKDALHSINGIFSHRNMDRWQSPDASGKPANGDDAIAIIGDELDIDTYIDVDYDSYLASLDKHFPNGNISPTLLFETSRGCWWGEKMQCAFCGLNGYNIEYRAMSPANAIRQFQSLFKYAGKCARLDGVDNIAPKNYLTEVFPKLNTPENMTIFYEVRADIGSEDIANLAKAGVNIIQPGIEALSGASLKLMKKGSTAFRSLAFLKNCVSHDVFPVWNLLVGFPGETADIYEKYYNDIPLMTHLAPPNGVFPIRFDRYSHYFNNRERYGLDLRPYDFYSLTYPFGEDSISRYAYYFVDHRNNGEHIAALAIWLDRMRSRFDGWLAQWRNEAVSQPKLCLRDDASGVFVYDTRFGAARNHRLNADELRALEILDNHKTENELSVAMSCDAGAVIKKLVECDLLFHENGRYMSLVMRREPPVATRRSGVHGSSAATKKTDVNRPALVKASRDARRVKTAVN